MITKDNKRSVAREVSFPLTEADEAKAAREMAQLDAEIQEIEIEKKKANAEAQQRIDEREEARRKLSAMVREKCEVRTITCEIVNNFEGNAVEYHFGGKKVDERPMEFADRQQDLTFAQEEARDTPPAPEAKAPKRKGKKSVADEEIANVRRLETGKRTKRNSVDGVYNGSSEPA